MSDGIESRAGFTTIRYAQVWEDADVLIQGLDVQPGDTCLSIASAGDNALALLTRDPARVLAVDLSHSQLACLALRIAAYRALEYEELLALIGSRVCEDRWSLYVQCREQGRLAAEHAAFWDARRSLIEAGIGAGGRFERYFRLFRRWVLPLIHGRGAVRSLLEAKPPAARRAFYEREWDNARWRLMFRMFFSRTIMGRLGRDPEFFRYVEGSVSDRILRRAEHAMTELDPAANPYMQWILLGRHNTALPLALRPEHFDAIRQRVDRVELLCEPIEAVIKRLPAGTVERFNLSDIFEYISAEDAASLFDACAAAGRPGGRLLYWNMLVPRGRPEELSDRLKPLVDLAAELHQQDKAFFYQRLVIDEVRP